MDNIAFNLSGLHIEEFTIAEEVFVEGQQNEMEIQITLSFRVVPEKKSILCRPEIVIFSNNNVLVTVTIVMSFSIEDISWGHMIRGNELHMERVFALNLASLAIGSARGVILAKTEGTGLDGKVMLPALQIDDLISEDVVIIPLQRTL